jgi:hypothetical protein
MKICSTCRESKDFSEFGKNSCKKDGLCAACRVCRNARRRSAYYKDPTKSIEAASKWNKENRVRTRETARLRYLKNPSPYREAAKLYYWDNAPLVKKYQKKWRQENPALCRALSAAKRARKMKATPPWLTPEDHFQIMLIYAQAALMTEASGSVYHVDHYVPLKGENVCGLHVPWNLRVIEAADNLRKKNKMPEELLDWVTGKTNGITKIN